MNTKLITALRTAANALENDTFYYDWSKPSACNCGVLFCALTGNSSAELNRRIPALLHGSQAYWSALVGQHCPITGMPTDELFRELFSHGLTQQDIVELELLDNAKVLARLRQTENRRRWYGAKMEPCDDYTDKVEVISYMRAWADILTEEGALDQVTESKTPALPCA